MKVLALIVLSLISISYCESEEDEISIEESEVESAPECKKSDAYLEKIMEKLTEISDKYEEMGKKGKGRMNGRRGWGRKDKSESDESNEDLDDEESDESDESDEKPGKSRGKGKGNGWKKRKGKGIW